MTTSKLMSEELNPYQAPQDSDMTAQRRGILRYSELPKKCPQCERPFAETLLGRRFKRKYRWPTIAYFASLPVGYFLLSTLFGGMVSLFLVFWLAAWGMTWAKKITLNCPACRWKKTYVVAGRGQRVAS